MIENGSSSAPKNANKFYCKKCDFKCSKKCEWVRHITTRKHNNDSNMIVVDSNRISTNTKYVCECGKSYKWDSGFYRHKKNCSIIQEKNKNTDIIDDADNKNTNLIIQALNQNKELINENKELQKLIMKQSKQMTTQSKQISELIPKVGNNNNNNTIKNKFNIQVFLNETCKDAMSITDFTNSLQLKLEDIMYSKERGTIEGLSKIIVRGLNELDIDKRPVHCTDVKRETLYIKDSEGWGKETNDKARIKQLITKTQQKHGQLLSDWQKTHPDWETSESQTTEFHELVCRLCYPEGGENKIIKNIAKEVIIDKE
jgi:hypothetical protein